VALNAYGHGLRQVIDTRRGGRHAALGVVLGVIANRLTAIARARSDEEIPTSVRHRPAMAVPSSCGTCHKGAGRINPATRLASPRARSLTVLIRLNLMHGK
jgi:hypothetical protein